MPSQIEAEFKRLWISAWDRNPPRHATCLYPSHRSTGRKIVERWDEDEGDTGRQCLRGICVDLPADRPCRPRVYRWSVKFPSLWSRLIQ